MSKSANRMPFGRDEGIYRKTDSAHRVRCVLCDRVFSTSRLVLASHGKAHIRRAEAVSVTVLDGGDGPRVVYHKAGT